MYTIIMGKSKELITTKRTSLFQREKLVDKIQFLFPQFYEDIDLTECTATIKYIDQGNVPHSETLVKDIELYKERIRYLALLVPQRLLQQLLLRMQVHLQKQVHLHMQPTQELQLIVQTGQKRLLLLRRPMLLPRLKLEQLPMPLILEPRHMHPIPELILEQQLRLLEQVVMFRLLLLQQELVSYVETELEQFRQIQLIQVLQLQLQVL